MENQNRVEFSLNLDESDIRIMEVILKTSLINKTIHSKGLSCWGFEKIIFNSKLRREKVSKSVIILQKLKKLNNYGLIGVKESLFDNGSGVRTVKEYFPSEKLKVKRAKLNGDYHKGILMDLGRLVFVQTA